MNLVECAKKILCSRDRASVEDVALCAEFIVKAAGGISLRWAVSVAQWPSGTARSIT